MPRADVQRSIRSYREVIQELAGHLHFISTVLDDENDEADSEAAALDGFDQLMPFDHVQESDDSDAEFFLNLRNFLLLMSQPLTGAGSRGAYFAFPKSKDFFEVSLQWPDLWFRCHYR